MDTSVFTHYCERENDVLSLIRNAIEENINLDYKACDSLQKTPGKKKELSKDVSAFANSDGGTIIYGVIEEGHIPKNIDIGYDPNDITKEWLEQVINSNIRTRIDGIIIKPIPLETQAPSKVIYAVHIPQSTIAHQAFDKRYYKRFNFESVPMEDYEIKDIINRCKHPIIEPQFSSRGVGVPKEDGYGVSEKTYKLDITLSNKGSVCAEHTKFIIAIPRDIIDYNYYEDQMGNIVNKTKSLPSYYNELVERRKNDTIYEISFKYAKPNGMLFPNDEKAIDRFDLKYKINQTIFDNIDEYNIIWKLYADNMPPKSGSIPLAELSDF